MNIPECFSCAGESMTFGEFASAEGLVIHVPFLYQSVSAFLKTATTPVLIPPQDFITSGQKGLRTYLRIQIGNGFIITSTVDNIAGPTAGRIDLLQVLPTGRGQGCGQEGVAVRHGIACRPQKAELEAFKAARTALGHFKAMRGGISDKLVAADGIFPERDDVGVAEEYSGTQAGAGHPFDDGGRAGSAAAMQQDAFFREVTTFRRLW